MIRKDVAGIFIKDNPKSVLNNLLIEKYRTRQSAPRIEDYTKKEYNIKNNSFQVEWELRFENEVKSFLEKEKENFICAKNGSILLDLSKKIEISKENNFSNYQNLKLEYELADLILWRIKLYEKIVKRELRSFKKIVYNIQENLHSENELLKTKYCECHGCE
ncbi:uncharacterized protein VNE69_04054 [Vairimorpha necatrix]|uniref:Uncharacterized protein n=1 Tax=Vairimorpha necatrix TaxID=6039 RepID=A0AAX4JB73_9MICR